MNIMGLYFSTTFNSKPFYKVNLLETFYLVRDFHPAYDFRKHLRKEIFVRLMDAPKLKHDSQRAWGKVSIDTEGIISIDRKCSTYIEELELVLLND